MAGLPTKSGIKKTYFTPGYIESSIRLSNGTDWPILISVPEQIIEKKVPLVIALHWGVTANEYREFMDCLILPAIDTSEYLVIAPLAQRQSWWEEPKEKQIARLIELAKEYWSITKVIMVGYSDGGTGAVHFATKHSDQIDGAIAVAGYYRNASYDVPTYVIHGVKDQLFSYSRSKAIIEKNQQSSKDLVFISSETLSHYEACSYVPLLKEGFKWMEEILEVD